jgi:hypothetical protein
MFRQLKAEIATRERPSLAGTASAVQTNLARPRSCDAAV